MDQQFSGFTKLMPDNARNVKLNTDAFLVENNRQTRCILFEIQFDPEPGVKMWAFLRRVHDGQIVSVSDQPESPTAWVANTAFPNQA